MLVVLPIQGTPSSEPHSLPLISPQGTGTATSLPFNPAKQIFAFSWLAQLNWSLAVRITDTFKFAWNTSTYFEDGLQNILESRTLLLSLSILHWFYLPVLILLASFPSCAIFLVNLQVTISAKDWLHSNHFSPSFPLWIDVLCVALVQELVLGFYWFLLSYRLFIWHTFTASQTLSPYSSWDVLCTL